MTIWKDVVGYEGRYQVSDEGQVKSLARTVTLRRLGLQVHRQVEECVLKPYAMSSGHLQISLSKNLKSKSLLIHPLVLEAFVGPRPGDSMQWHGCHFDGDPSNNRIDNLRWDTRSGNEMDKVAHGRSNRGERNRAVKLIEAQVLEIRSRILKGDTSPAIAIDYGVTRALINAIKRGSAWSWL